MSNDIHIIIATLTTRVDALEQRVAVLDRGTLVGGQSVDERRPVGGAARGGRLGQGFFGGKQHAGGIRARRARV